MALVRSEARKVTIVSCNRVGEHNRQIPNIRRTPLSTKLFITQM